MEQNELVAKDLFDNIKVRHKSISDETTPPPYIEHREDGFDYVDEGYMRGQLNAHFPIWSWEIKKYEVLGDVEIIVHGRLTIIDEGVTRYFDAIASHRIAKNQKGYVNISNNLKSANTDAFKVAVNRLCNVADDVYRKQLKDYTLSKDQVDELADAADELDAATTLKISEGIKDMTIHAENFDKVMNKIKKMKENKDGNN